MSTTFEACFEKIFPILIAAFMINAGVDFNLKNLVLSSPSAKVVKALVYESAVDSMFITRKEILKEEAKVYLSCDKGHSMFMMDILLKKYCGIQRLNYE